jgi:hypothetical protein
MDIVERGSKKALVKQRREAPAVFKHRGMYYMVTSGCTSWAPNGALVHVAESMLGQWVTLGDPCVGGEEGFGSITFFSQGTFVLPLPGLENTFIFMADRLVVDPHVWWMNYIICSWHLHLQCWLAPLQVNWLCPQSIDD